MASEPADPTGLEFRLRNVRAGVALSVFCCTYLLGYCAITWSRPHRDVLLGLAISSIASSLLMLRLRLEPVMRDPRWREAFFMGWSSLLILFVTILVLVDGGVTSPIATVYFLPLVFAALSYPVRSMIAVSVIDVAAYIVAAVAVGGVSTTVMAFVALHAGLRELDVRLAGAHPRAPAQRVQPRLARRRAHRGAEPPRLRRALRRRAEPRGARGHDGRAHPRRPRRLQGHERPPRPRRRRR